MHIRLADIEWDCDGMDPEDDCRLPLNVLVIDVPDSIFLPEVLEKYREALFQEMTEIYGFSILGCGDISPINLDGRYPFSGGIYRQTTAWGDLIQGVMASLVYPIVGLDAFINGFCLHCAKWTQFISRGGYRSGGDEYCCVCQSHRKTQMKDQDFIKKRIDESEKAWKSGSQPIVPEKREVYNIPRTASQRG
jgi:hypothetical protein